MTADADNVAQKQNAAAEEWERLAAMIAEAKRNKEIADVQTTFEPVYREIMRSSNYYLPDTDVDSSQTPKYVDHTTIHYLKKANPSVEEVAIARGIIKIIRPGAKK